MMDEQTILSEDDKKLSRKESKRRYNQSEKGKKVRKEAMKRYLATEAGKQAQRRALQKYRLSKNKVSPEIYMDKE